MNLNKTIVAALCFITINTIVSASNPNKQSTTEQDSETILISASNTTESFIYAKPQFSAATAVYNLSVNLHKWASKDSQCATIIEKNHQSLAQALLQAQQEEQSIHQGFIAGMICNVHQGIKENMEWDDQDWAERMSQLSSADLISRIQKLKPAAAKVSLKGKELKNTELKKAALLKENDELRQRIAQLKTQQQSKNKSTTASTSDSN